MSLCFELIANNIAATIKGRDIGKSLAKIVCDVAENNSVTNEDFLPLLAAYEQKQLAVIQSKHGDGGEMEQESLRDRVQCIAVIFTAKLHLIKSPLDLCRYIEELFDAPGKGNVILCSVHRAKGLEAQNVGILRADLMPHPKATLDWQRQQEINLKYVALTRSKETLFFIEENAPGRSQQQSQNPSIEEIESVVRYVETIAQLPSAIDETLTPAIARLVDAFRQLAEQAQRPTGAASAASAARIPASSPAPPSAPPNASGSGSTSGSGSVYIELEGKGYPVREELKQIGCYWNKFAGAWMAPQNRAEEAQEIIDNYNGSDND